METLNERLLEYKVKNVNLLVDKVTKPSGNETKRIVVDFPEAVAILPVIDDKNIIIVKQYRYAIKQDLYELPAGKIDPGEELKDALKRELGEETGYTSNNFKKLMTIVPASGYSSERLHLYIASHLKKSSKVVDPDEISEVKIIKISEIITQILDNTIIDPLITLCVLLGERKGFLSKNNL